MIIPQINQPHIYDRASAGSAGGGIAVGGVAAKNSGGSEQSTKFIIGFCVAIPCTLIIVGLYFYFRRRRNKKLDKTGAQKNGQQGRSRNSAWGKKNRKKGNKKSIWRLPETLRPTEPPAAYKREKELLPSSL